MFFRVTSVAIVIVFGLYAQDRPAAPADSAQRPEPFVVAAGTKIGCAPPAARIGAARAGCPRCGRAGHIFVDDGNSLA